MTHTALAGMGIKVRQPEPDDYPFIYATMLKCLNDSRDIDIPKSVFFREEHKGITSLLEHDDVIVRIACLDDEPSVIVGYAIFEIIEPCIHFFYIKGPFRRKLIGTHFMRCCIGSLNGIEISHLTKDARSSWKKHNLVFNPYRLAKYVADAEGLRRPLQQRLSLIQRQTV